MSLFLISCSGFASEYAKKRQQEVANIAKTTSPSSLPGFVTGTPPETNLNNIDSLQSAVGTVYSSNKMAADFKKSAENRPYFVIDPVKDPIVKNTKEGMADPEKYLAQKSYKRRPQITYEYKTCQEAKPGTEYKCTRTLLMPEIHIEPAKYAHYWCAMGNHQPDDPRCAAKTYYNPARMYKAEVVTITKERWVTTCQALEEKKKTGVCRLIRTVCPKGRETRQVQGSLGQEGKVEMRPITKECWRYEDVYQCSQASVNTCEALRQSGCDQLRSKCIRKIGDECVEWEQKYRCPQEILESAEEISSKGSFHLPEGSSSIEEGPNNDMQDAISKLSIFEEIQREIRVQPTVENIKVFKGDSRKCTIAFANFSNCCASGNGWGISLNLSSCNGEEKDLVERQKRSLCVEIGTYCAEKIPVVGCIRKKKSHCCFPSRLSRILHEQGRRQLNMGWGSAENPDCRGFTPEELSRINFDQLDFKEIFEEITSRTKEISSTVVKRNMSDRVSTMTKGLTNTSTTGDF